MNRRDQAVVILQARMNSQRLPGKALHLLAGHPLVTHCLDRLTAAGVGPVVLATTTSPSDDLLAELGHLAGVGVVRGASQDVLERFVMTLAAYQASVVIRATADNPAVDSGAPARVLHALLDASADYVSEDGLPFGAAVEAVRAETLILAHRHAHTVDDRAHVTTWIKRHTDRWRVRVIPAPTELQRPDLRFTVDTAVDLVHMRRVLVAAGAHRGVVPLGAIIRAADGLEAAEVA